MDPAVFQALSFVFPSIITLIGVIVANLWIRRSARERNQNDREVADDTNGTNAFTTITNQLFKLNDDLREEVDTLKKQVGTLMRDAAHYKEQIGQLTEDLEETDKKWRSQISVTRQLANYIKLLIAAWPMGAGPIPDPDPPIDWKVHL